MRKDLALLYFLLIIFCNSCNEHQNEDAISSDKDKLIVLEAKCLEAEFALDTAYISPFIDKSCLVISEEGIHNKQEYLISMYSNISQRIKDSIFVDSFKLENEIVNLYHNTAVVTFIVHTYKKTKGIPIEKRTRFYDVWIKDKKDWKMVASQGTPVKE
ncbi:MAG: nuclear transport factor 2 family protein [Ferruginibacter sp.]